MYGAMRNSSRSAAAGMMSSLQSSLMPSAGGCSQPNRPPTRVGPSRSWIRAETFRSSQMNTAAETMTNANSKRALHQAGDQCRRAKAIDVLCKIFGH